MSYSAQLSAQMRAANPDSARINAALRAKAYQGLAQAMDTRTFAPTTPDIVSSEE